MPSDGLRLSPLYNLNTHYPSGYVVPQASIRPHDAMPAATPLPAADALFVASSTLRNPLRNRLTCGSARMADEYTKYWASRMLPGGTSERPSLTYRKWGFFPLKRLLRFMAI